MVRAILTGEKTQTRRTSDRWAKAEPGDLLWVRETHARCYFDDGRTAYRIDWDGAAADLVREPKWTPSILMRRKDARILLTLTAKRRERAHDISDADIAAEGVTVAAAVALLGKRAPKGITWPSEPWTLRDAWRIGWSAINGAESWEANPWVWALSFQRVEVLRG